MTNPDIDPSPRATPSPPQERPGAQTIIYAPAVEGNQRQSPLYRVPEEILRMIVKNLDGDVVALLCLGQVSRRLRRHAHAEFLPRDLSDVPDWRAEAFEFLWDVCGQYTALKKRSEHDWRLLRRLLRQDRLCQSCLLSDVNGDEPWDGCKFTCQDPNYTLYCAGCDCVHPSSVFSVKEKANDDSRRICIGREVPLRLCEHHSIRWVDVESQLLYLANPKNRGGLVLTVSELICDHTSHKKKGASPDSGTNKKWAPRLRVGVTTGSDIAIECFWTATHRLPVNHDGRINAQDMASLFDADLRDDARFIISAAGTKAGIYQAMQSFADPSCTCLTYHSDTNHATHVVSGDFNICKGLHYSVLPIHLLGKRDGESGEESIDVQRQYSGEQARSVLLDITYKREIGRFNIGEMLSVGKLESAKELPQPARYNPPHFWFHAVDRASYTLDQDPAAVGHVWPACHDTSCGNYVVTRQATHCPAHEFDRKLYNN